MISIKLMIIIVAIMVNIRKRAVYLGVKNLSLQRLLIMHCLRKLHKEMNSINFKILLLTLITCKVSI